MKLQKGEDAQFANLISFFFIFLPLFSHENAPIGLVNHIGAFSYSQTKRVLPMQHSFLFS